LGEDIAVRKSIFIVAAIVVAIIALGSLSSRDDEAQAAKQVADAKAAALRAQERRETAIAKCRSEADQLAANYESLFKQRQYLQAAAALRECAELTGAEAFKKAIASAEIADYIASADDTKVSIRERIMVLDKFHKDYPEAYKSRAALYSELNRRLAAQEAAEKRSRGVTIGMSQEEVIASSWGKPRKINRTTYSWGTKEQWVYDGGYLYFTNGVLDAIQN
jgi:hypothetical protein